MTGLDLAAAAGRALHFTALAVIVGAGLAPELGAGSHRSTTSGVDALEVVSRRWRRSGAFGLVAALALLLATQAVAFRDPFEPWSPQIAGLVFRTDWGRTFTAQLLLALLLLLPAARARGRAVLGFGLASCATLAFTGHSWAATSAQPWVVVADAIHAVAAGLWVGGLLVLVGAVRLDRAAAARRGLAVAEVGRSFDLAGAVIRFSTLAQIAVPALALTGVVASWVHGGGPAALLTPGWGRALAVKVALFGGMALLGLYNWRVTLPALRRRADAVGFGRGPAAWEALAGVAVLIVTAALVGLSPPS